MDAVISRRGVLGSVGAAAVGLLAGSDAASATPQAARLPAKILLRAGISDEHVQRVRAISPDVTIARDMDLSEANAILGNVSRDEFDSAKSLRWVQCPSAGVEHLLHPALVDSEVILTNAQGCYAPEIAEHALGLLFSLTRGIGAESRKRQWGYDGKPVELRGMTMGIVGLGGIGREVARRAKALDMKVIAVDAEPMLAERFAMVDEVRLVDDGLSDLLKRSDVLVLAAPSTTRTRGMIGAEQFAQMKDGAYLVNVARGKLVQTEALMDALKTGKLSGAGLDVTDPEPLPAGHPLWSFANVTITSHIAGQSQFSWSRVQNLFVDNVVRYIGGLPMLNVVDKHKGY